MSIHRQYLLCVQHEALHMQAEVIRTRIRLTEATDTDARCELRTELGDIDRQQQRLRNLKSSPSAPNFLVLSRDRVGLTAIIHDLEMDRAATNCPDERAALEGRLNRYKVQFNELILLMIGVLTEDNTGI